MKNSLLVLICLVVLLTSQVSLGQFRVKGTVTDESGDVISGVNISVKSSAKGTITDQKGHYELELSGNSGILSFTHVSYQSKELRFDAGNKQAITIDVVLKVDDHQLQDIEVVDSSLEVDIQNPQKIASKSARSLPSTFGDFNKILVTLPGVSSNNELSSAYSVRGGNFDENLVYVNDIPVYRPFLANAGRQEGLSFVNPDLVQDIEFYAGGWEPKYGDKLSSSLNIEYKEPQKAEGSMTLGLLGGSAYSGGKKGRLSYLVGVRHRDSRYLLNSLETKGQYFPTYTDFQGSFTFDLSPRESVFLNKTKLNILVSYGRNRYFTKPASLTTDFGSIQQNFRLQTAFEGQELLSYDTYQVGFRFTHRFNQRLRSHVIGASLLTQEKEHYDVEGAYRLCDVNNNPGSSSFDECVVIRGIGSNYEYGRNSLDARLLTLENRYEYLLNVNHIVEAGIGVNAQNVSDKLNEYKFIDSADYVHITESTFNDISVSPNQYYGYVQNTVTWNDSVHALSSGVRFTWWNYNDELLISPRVSYRLAPKWDQITTFKLSVGLYQQPPFYRELRNFNGQVNKNIKAQKSLHFIGTFTRLFYMWGRPFLFNADAYRKQLWDIIPYDIDNVRLRYFSDRIARGYAHGVDFRVHGEFVKGTQSWFSLGVLQTREDIDGDGYGSFRRPTDQRINLAAYFEDHMPRDPSLRVYLNLVFGSGYPLGPPNSFDLRNAYSGDEYYRADIGLSKSFDMIKSRYLEKLWLRLEVLNALAADNTLSYTWIEDVNGYQFAVPNSLSARFLNVKVSVEF